MAEYFIFGSLTIWNIVMTARERKKASEFYAHLSLAIFFGTILLVFILPYEADSGQAFYTVPISIPALYMTGFGMVIAGLTIYSLALRALRVAGNPRKGSHLETERMVTSGVYRYARHPMALAVLLICLGLVLWQLHIGAVITYAVVVIFYIIAIRKEEEELVRKFEEDYLEYRKRVPALNIIRGWYRALNSQTREPQ
ncbi:MAG: isoprenylcysteine carboxylmethyltransferase family protein [Dehalococcoidales bacterium]